MSTLYEKSDSKPPSGSGSCLYDLLCSETPRWDRPSDAETTTSWFLRKEQKSSGARTRLERMLEESGNSVCADCGSPDPKWVSLSLGVFVCIKCSGVHRSLGTHISKVLSVKLDEWTDDQVDSLVNLGGNNVVNNKYEAFLPDSLSKPRSDSSIEERSDFIRRKYEMQQFLEGNEQTNCLHQTSSSTLRNASNNHFSDKKHSDKQSRHRIGQRFRNSWGRKDCDQLKSRHGEFVGLIKVNVVKGTDLAVRDMLTSDPYVILALGQQSVRTRVIRNSLNPIWNESLMLSIPESIPPLKVLVYDKDTFKADDFMGDAEIDIQPLVAAAKAYEKSEINESMQPGKSVASKENHLVKDGTITLTDGRVKQEISLRLQNVERGTLEIELDCVPLTQ
ncbi:putative ADP-ribosylation factor GTPase-activating protein AGD11 [Hibiscus syriacus]|uniref:ADP-ribosylation factor GTPase-activating protein AGD11 n=1 Tax=Hibiscus syriacus TaxID=106335 RepID=A0A6A3C010_HIBSY|nr:putative ADP-ribosylation factor GTPase-activating protein AGD11 [Hibiscus syriacus]